MNYNNGTVYFKLLVPIPFSYYLQDSLKYRKVGLKKNKQIYRFKDILQIIKRELP